MLELRDVRKAIAGRWLAPGLALFLLPLIGAVPGLVANLQAQDFPSRLRRPPLMPADVPPAPQNAPVVTPQTQAPQTPVPQSQAQQPAAPPGALPPSVLQQPAQPAKIEFSENSLSIRADNSSLAEILRAFSSKSGMQLQGFSSDERVFGTFGPGSPRDVLSDLLNGTPYNLLMVGDLSNGAPRQLILSAASQASVSSSPGPVPPAPPVEEQDDEASDPAPQPQQVVHPQVGTEAPANSQTVKTPQQLFQELQALRQQREQQQQAQQPQ